MLFDFLPRVDTNLGVRPLEVSLLETPGSHTVITWEAPYTLGQPRTLHSRVLVDGQWMPTREPLPGQLNARGEGLIGFTRTETGEYYWMPNLTASSLNPYSKPTALWRNGKVLTISDLLGPNVDAQQVGTLWDINDHGLIAANSPTHGPALLLPVELVDTKDGILDDQVPQGTTLTPAMRDVSIEPKKDANDKRLQTVAWIDPHGAANEKDPEMPWLTLRFRGVEEMCVRGSVRQTSRAVSLKESLREKLKLAITCRWAGDNFGKRSVMALRALSRGLSAWQSAFKR